MNRLLVALLAAFDAVIAVAVGIAAALAPLTLLWVFGWDAPADWSALWPASARVWQLGHFVPVSVTLPQEYLTATGIPADAASFVLSLAPLAFASFTAVFAARSGVRAAHGGAWAVGVVAGTITVGALAAAVAVTADVPIARVELWQAIVLPAVVFAVPALAGATVDAWREGDGGWIDAVRERVDAQRAWRDVPAAIARGAGVVVAGLVGVGALVVAAGLVARGGEVVALFEAAHVDLVGVIVLALGQLAYLPTLVVWGAAFAAGPGFAIGTGTTVSPAGTSLGVLPGVPALGIVPEAVSPWLLLLALGVVGVGAFAGWTARARLSPVGAAGDAAAREAMAPRLVALAGVVALASAAAALLAVAASGSIGPGRLAHTGPEAGPLALAVGVEIALGAGIVLLSGHRDPRPYDLDRPAADEAPAEYVTIGFADLYGTLDPPAATADPEAPDAGASASDPEAPDAGASASDPDAADPGATSADPEAPEPDEPGGTAGPR